MSRYTEIIVDGAFVIVDSCEILKLIEKAKEETGVCIKGVSHFSEYIKDDIALTTLGFDSCDKIEEYERPSAFEIKTHVKTNSWIFIKLNSSGSLCGVRKWHKVDNQSLWYTIRPVIDCSITNKESVCFYKKLTTLFFENVYVESSLFIDKILYGYSDLIGFMANYFEEKIPNEGIDFCSVLKRESCLDLDDIVYLIKEISNVQLIY